jgi:hypothetical protein
MYKYLMTYDSVNEQNADIEQFNDKDGLSLHCMYMTYLADNLLDEEFITNLRASQILLNNDNDGKGWRVAKDNASLRETRMYLREHTTWQTII